MWSSTIIRTMVLRNCASLGRDPETLHCRTLINPRYVHYIYLMLLFNYSFNYFKSWIRPIIIISTMVPFNSVSWRRDLNIKQLP